MSYHLHFIFTYYNNIILFVVCFVELLGTIQATIAPKLPIYLIFKKNVHNIINCEHFTNIQLNICFGQKRLSPESFVFVLRQNI